MSDNVGERSEIARIQIFVDQFALAYLEFSPFFFLIWILMFICHFQAKQKQITA
jgi:hypothetical protein